MLEQLASKLDIAQTYALPLWGAFCVAALGLLHISLRLIIRVQQIPSVKTEKSKITEVSSESKPKNILKNLDEILEASRDEYLSRINKPTPQYGFSFEEMDLPDKEAHTEDIEKNIQSIRNDIQALSDALKRNETERTKTTAELARAAVSTQKSDIER